MIALLENVYFFIYIAFNHIALLWIAVLNIYRLAVHRHLPNTID